MAEERRAVPIRLTEQAWDGLDHLAERNGVTRTALLEALGRLARTTKLPQPVISEARQIDRARHSRRRRVDE